VRGRARTAGACGQAAPSSCGVAEAAPDAIVDLPVPSTPAPPPPVVTSDGYCEAPVQERAHAASLPEPSPRPQRQPPPPPVAREESEHERSGTEDASEEKTAHEEDTAEETPEDAPEQMGEEEEEENEAEGGPTDDGREPFSFWETRVQPSFLYTTMAFVHEHALRVEGVFRISASTARIAELKAAQKDGRLEEELVKCTETPNEILAVADFMNKHFQDAPIPLMPVHIFQEVCQTADVSDIASKREELRQLIYNMSETSLNVFCALLNIAYDAAQYCDETKMHAGNLAICIGPNIMYDPTPTLDVVAVRKEAGLMTSSLAEFIRDFPQIFEDVKSGAWKEKGTCMKERLGARLAATEAENAPQESSPQPIEKGKKKKPKVGMSSFFKKKLKAASTQKLPESEFAQRRRESSLKEPTTDDKQKHHMLQSMSVKLVEMDASEVCLLSFHTVKEYLIEADFSEPDIDRHEKFLKQAILTLVTNLHS